jgi:ADP-ribosyl-[dinitrogen reductase] hydrolase
MTVTERDRYHGALLGLAAGDALGTTLEFKPPGSFTLVNDMVGGGPFGLAPGEWTDDTSMALCLAASLIERQGFDAADAMRRFVDWWQNGTMSSTGRCFDIGHTTREALSTFERSGNPFAGSTSPHTAGNGSLMRLAPIPMAFAKDLEKAVLFAAESSRTTHGAATAVDACRYFAALLVGALRGKAKEALLSEAYWQGEPLRPKIAAVAAGSFKRKEPPEIRGSGYVVESLEAALWAFHRSETFKEGALMAVNLGDDADTTGAVYGQLAGAYYGASAIPSSWRDKVAHRDLILELAGGLLALSHHDSMR